MKRFYKIRNWHIVKARMNKSDGSGSWFPVSEHRPIGFKIATLSYKLLNIQQLLRFLIQIHTPAGQTLSSKLHQLHQLRVGTSIGQRAFSSVLPSSTKLNIPFSIIGLLLRLTFKPNIQNILVFNSTQSAGESPSDCPCV
jgi:hypothetical protein